MVSFTSLFTACTAVVGALAYPTELSKRETLTDSKTGTSNGFYYSFWTDGAGDVTYTNEAAGKYSVQWSGGKGNFVGGKGWETGKARTISYKADYNVQQGGSYLAIYGWTRDPLIEYYIVESYGDYNPGGSGEKVGEVTSDGGTYELFTAQRTNAASIEGTKSFTQYWSVRKTHRTSGDVTVGNHFDAWKKQGLDLGTFDYQIVATEGVNSAGSSTVTVSEGK